MKALKLGYDREGDLVPFIAGDTPEPYETLVEVNRKIPVDLMES